MKTIQLRGKRGGAAVVDDDDFVRLSQFKWYPLVRSARQRTMKKSTMYAARWKDNRPILMHREILEAPPDRQVDHVNHDGLDNRRSNLRLCTNGQNAASSTRQAGLTGFRGVTKRAEGRFHARAWANGKTIHLGDYDTAEEAARARDVVVAEILGEFAVLNFPAEGRAL